MDALRLLPTALPRAAVSLCRCLAAEPLRTAAALAQELEAYRVFLHAKVGRREFVDLELAERIAHSLAELLERRYLLFRQL